MQPRQPGTWHWVVVNMGPNSLSGGGSTIAAFVTSDPARVPAGENCTVSFTSTFSVSGAIVNSSARRARSAGGSEVMASKSAAPWRNTHSVT